MTAETAVSGRVLRGALAPVPGVGAAKKGKTRRGTVQFLYEYTKELFAVRPGALPLTACRWAGSERHPCVLAISSPFPCVFAKTLAK